MMARYLIVGDDDMVVGEFEATSMRAAMEELDPQGNGAFHIYTITGARAVEFHTVTETRLVFPDSGTSSEEEE